MAQMLTDGLEWVSQASGILFAVRWLIFCFILFGALIVTFEVGVRVPKWIVRYLKYIGILHDPNRYRGRYYQLPYVVPKLKEEKTAEAEKLVMLVPDTVLMPQAPQNPEELYDEYTDESAIEPTHFPSDDTADMVPMQDLLPLSPRKPKDAESLIPQLVGQAEEPDDEP